MSSKRRSDDSFKKHLLVMIFINMCPVFHWVRNNRRILNYYYYVCLAEFERVKDKDSEVLDLLHRDLIASRNSFDKLYGLANFMNSYEYKRLIQTAPTRQISRRIRKRKTSK